MRWRRTKSNNNMLSCWKCSRLARYRIYFSQTIDFKFISAASAISPIEYNHTQTLIYLYCIRPFTCSNIIQSNLYSGGRFSFFGQIERKSAIVDLRYLISASNSSIVSLRFCSLIIVSALNELHRFFFYLSLCIE